MQSLTAYCFSVLVVWSNTVIGSVVISKERFKLDLCLPGWLSSNIIHGPTLSKNDRHLCMRDEHIRRDSHQNFLRKTPHSVTKSKQCRISRPQFLWSTHGTPGTMTPLLVTKALAYYDSGFPMEARVIGIFASCCGSIHFTMSTISFVSHTDQKPLLLCSAFEYTGIT